MTLAILAAGLLGLVLGSLANVLAHRVPRGIPVRSRPPFCPRCEARINGLDILPVVSWLALRGRCRTCREPISPRYPIVELSTALLFAAMTFRLGLVWVLPGYLTFTVVTVTLVLTDLDWKRIPNAILFPGGAVAGAVLTVGAVLDGQGVDMGRAVAAGALYFGALFLVAVITRGGMGMGDVKLAALLGLFTGYMSWAVFTAGAILGFLIGGLVGLALLVTRRKGRKDEVPFGPPLILGAWMAILGQPWVADWIPHLS